MDWLGRFKAQSAKTKSSKFEWKKKSGSLDDAKGTLQPKRHRGKTTKMTAEGEAQKTFRWIVKERSDPLPLKVWMDGLL